jgi:nitrite reductase/ring-hydroxylating ferredoxin subunit
MKITQATLKNIIKEEIAKLAEESARIAKADRRRAGMEAGEIESEKTAEDRPGVFTEEEGIFAPSHYCVHHGGVQHEGKIKMAEAVNHNYSRKHGRVTHYDMKLANGTILENVAAEDIQVTNASLAEGHHDHVAKRDREDHDLDDLYAMVRNLERKVDGMSKK